MPPAAPALPPPLAAGRPEPGPADLRRATPLPPSHTLCASPLATVTSPASAPFSSHLVPKTSPSRTQEVPSSPAPPPASRPHSPLHAGALLTTASTHSGLGHPSAPPSPQQDFRYRVYSEGPRTSPSGTRPAKPCQRRHPPGCPSTTRNATCPHMNSASSLHTCTRADLGRPLLLLTSRLLLKPSLLLGGPSTPLVHLENVHPPLSLPFQKRLEQRH